MRIVMKVIIYAIFTLFFCGKGNKTALKLAAVTG